MLGGVGPAHPAKPQRATIDGLREDVAALDAAALVQGLGGREPGSRRAEGVLEGDPQGMAEEGDEDRGLE